MLLCAVFFVASSRLLRNVNNLYESLFHNVMFMQPFSEMALLMCMFEWTIVGAGLNIVRTLNWYSLIVHWTDRYKCSVSNQLWHMWITQTEILIPYLILSSEYSCTQFQYKFPITCTQLWIQLLMIMWYECEAYYPCWIPFSCLR